MQKRDSQTIVVAGALSFYVQVITSGRLFSEKNNLKKKGNKIQAHWESREKMGDEMTMTKNDDESPRLVSDLLFGVGNSLLRLAKYPCVRRIL